MCSVLLKRGWRTSGCHSSSMLWEWQSHVLQPLFRQWQDCITVILLTNKNQRRKQKNHDVHELPSFLIRICPVFIIRGMSSVSVWLGLLNSGHVFARWISKLISKVTVKKKTKVLRKQETQFVLKVKTLMHVWLYNNTFINCLDIHFTMNTG